jgi:hypothetical protein
MGEGEYNVARANGLVEGVADLVKGKKNSVIGSVVGDKTQQAQGEFLFHNLMRRRLLTMTILSRHCATRQGPGSEGPQPQCLSAPLCITPSICRRFNQFVFHRLHTRHNHNLNPYGFIGYSDAY